MYHIVDPFALLVQLVNVHCNDSLVWFQVSGFLIQNVHWVLTRATLQYPVTALSLEYLEPASSRAPAGPKWGRC